MTCILLAMDLGVGGLEMCNLMENAQMKPEFLSMNPFHHIPTLKDGEVALGESNAILHYLANKYKPEYYPVADPVTCAKVDFAMGSFKGDVYPLHEKVVYPVMGFVGPPDDQEASNKKMTEQLDAWTTHFLKGKFVCGDKLSIADFMAVPLIFAQMQPGVYKKTGWKPNDRAMQYVEDFCAAVPAAGMLKEAGGYSIAEWIASKVPDAGPPLQYKKVDYQPLVIPKPEGKGVKVYGMPPSQNSMTGILLAMDLGVGGLEMCNIMEGAQMKPEFLSMNPFHHIPTLKDGEVALAESSAILRYLALKYKPEYYPTQSPALCAKVDFAMDSFEFEVYAEGHTKVVYPVMGFVGFPEDQSAANKKYTEVLDTWSKHFLTGKFVCGDKISIADFKAVPFIFAAMQPGVKAKTGFVLSDRAIKYVEDFCAVVSATSMLKEAGGYSIAEYIASKTQEELKKEEPSKEGSATEWPGKETQTEASREEAPNAELKEPKEEKQSPVVEEQVAPNGGCC
jgi:glutathione S-transferase